MSRSDLVDIEVVVLRETDKAWGFENPHKLRDIIWIPKSLCEVEEKPAPSKDGTLTCSLHLATEKGLV
jgi:hypothetical protein